MTDLARVTGTNPQPREYRGPFGLIVRIARSLRNVWSRSLQLRVVAATVSLGLVVVGTVAFVIADQIREQLFAARQNEILADAQKTRESFEADLKGMTADTEPAAQQFLRDWVYNLQTSTPGSQRQVILLRSNTNDSRMSLLDFAGYDQSIVTADLRSALRNSTGAWWKSTTMQYRPIDAAEESTKVTVPAIIVGQQVPVPVAGTYDLFLVYDLHAQQKTLTSVQRTLAWSGLVLVLLVGGVAWVVTRLVVAPLREAAAVAERLSSGNLGERMKRRGQDDLAILAGSFNNMAESLQDKIERMAELSRLQRRFVSDVSHELRTPVTTIRMAADMIYGEREDFDPVTKRSTELLHNQVDRFEQLLADLLEISRFDAGAATLDARVTDVVPVVEGVIEMVTPLAEHRNVTLVTDCPDRLDVYVESLRLDRVLRNLLVNAIEHTEDAAVEVTVAASEEAFSLVVRDHGVGIDTADLNRVFDRFWRADPSRARTTGGTGLGLSIAREDARLHSGHLEVWGRKGEGAAFRLTLPLVCGGSFVEAAAPLPDRGHDIWEVAEETPAGAPETGSLIIAHKLED